MSRVTQENSKRSEALVATGSVDDDDMVSCFSDTDDFHSCADVDEEENVFVFAANAVDTAESGPLTFRAPGGVAPRYAPADSRESAPRTAGETGGGPLGVVSAIRVGFRGPVRSGLVARTPARVGRQIASGACSLCHIWFPIARLPGLRFAQELGGGRSADVARCPRRISSSAS